MFKKFLAAVVLIATFATSTTSALGGDPIPGSSEDTGAITNFVVTPSTFAPSKGETAKITFKVTETVQLQAYVIDSTGSTKANFASFVTTNAGDVSYTWNGKVNGADLPNGKYTVKAVAYKNNSQVASRSQEVTINTTGTPENEDPVISDLEADPTSFSAAKGQSTNISFELDKDAYLTVEVKKGSTVVKTFTKYSHDFVDAGEYSVSWVGEDDDEEEVDAGTYTVVITAENAKGNTTTETLTVNVTEQGTNSDGSIEDFELNPSQDWDPTDEELEISYEINEEVDSLEIEATNGKQVIEITDDEFVDDTDYEDTWDGTDEDGDYIDEGVWTITLRADGDVVSDTIKVEYDQPDFVEAFVTKDSFDPSSDEFTNLVFKVNTTSDVTVEVYQGSKKEATLLKDEEVRKNRWYAVEFDGVDDNGDEVNEGSDWRFEITAENTTDNDIDATENVEFEVEEDEVSDKKINITNDYTTPVIFEEDSDNELVFNYDLEDDAEVFLAIYEGNSTSGNEEAELMDYVEQDSGEHTVEWDLEDEDGRELDKGIYTYKLISRNDDGGSKETEIGRFVIGSVGDITEDDDDDNDDNDNDDDDNDDDDDDVVTCGGYTDTQFVDKNDYETCMAIEWATERGIFMGYDDGSFGPYNNISRSEVLKVVFEAYDNVVILPSDGTKLGFTDVDSSAWYMPYIRTGKFYGMVNGYPDNSFRSLNNVSRAEFLKFALEASESFTGYKVPNYSFSYFADVDVNNAGQSWFKNYAGVAYEMGLMNFSDNFGSVAYMNPAQNMTRGEVALALYRMYNTGLLGFYDEMFEND